MNMIDKIFSDYQKDNQLDDKQMEEKVKEMRDKENEELEKAGWKEAPVGKEIF